MWKICEFEPPILETGKPFLCPEYIHCVYDSNSFDSLVTPIKSKQNMLKMFILVYLALHLKSLSNLK